MHFESVTAHAFGPLHNDKPLTLAPGMNVVHGPNESGKSSWHAALQTALCGVKLKGPQTKQVREFIRQRKPWRGTERWNVEAVVALADGRQIELRQDLTAKSGSAHDAEIAKQDYSAEIIDADGMLDGSIWLGLDRVSFLNIACVRQAEMLAVREGAADIQGVLQKAADKADMDNTAGAALKLLADFRSNQVGSLKAPAKPLRRTMAAVSDAKDQLDLAHRDFNKHLHKQHDVKRLEAAVTELQRKIKAVQAHEAHEAAVKADQRLQHVRELKQLVGDEPPMVVDDAALAVQVAAAVASWENAPNPTQPVGETGEYLTRQRADLVDEKTQIEGVKSNWRPAIRFLLIGLGLFVAAAWCLSMQQPLVFSVGASAAGLGTVWWSFARGRRRAKENREERLRELAEAVRDLEGKIARRSEDDSTYEDAMVQREKARQKLDLAASAAGLPQYDGPAQQVAALGGWQTERLLRLERTAEQTKIWGKLQGLMAGMSHEEIESEAFAKREEADALLAECDKTRLQAVRSSVNDLTKLQKSESAEQKKLNNARGALELFAKGMASVADAEDDLDEANRRLEHLETLDQTLKTTTEFLERAQKRVHRDMARVLRSTLQDWLPRTTAGRYKDCALTHKPWPLRYATFKATGGMPICSPTARRNRSTCCCGSRFADVSLPKARAAR